MVSGEAPPLVLVVDDQAAMRELAGAALAGTYRILQAGDGQEALRLIHEHRPDVVLLDVTMPVMDGLTTLRRLRDFSTVPVILVTADGGDHQVANGLDSGAQDYIVKPFSPMQLAARVRATLRDQRSVRSEPAEILTFDDGRLVLDTGTRCAVVRGVEVTLTATEYRVLELLCRNPRRVLSLDQIVIGAWGQEYAGELGYVKTYVGLLRNKIELDSRRPVYLRSRRGLGYYFDPNGRGGVAAA